MHSFELVFVLIGRRWWVGLVWLIFVRVDCLREGGG